MKKKKYDAEFKEKLVKESLEIGNASLVGRKYDVHPGVVTRWVRESKKQPNKELQKNVLSSYQSLSQEPVDLESALNQNRQLKAIVGKKELEIAVLTDLLKKTSVQ
ncbi:transposase [Aerococcus urinaeequi]|uniref:transposase n=1 Tax=Aerococcus urinaeequi TaxID=51665 RepID=UPI003D6A4958